MSEKKILNNDIVSVSTGKLGIGTDSPTNKLDVRSANGAAIIVGRTNNSGTNSEPGYFNVYAPNASGTDMLWSQIRTVVDDATAASEDSSIYFHNRNAGSFATAMTIRNSGNVGIGTTSPQVKLEVRSAQDNTVAPANAVAKFVGNDAGVFVGNLAGTPNYGAWLQAMRESDALAFPLHLQPLGGNVGIGTTNPDTKLQVAATGSVGLSVRSNTSGDAYMRLYSDATIEADWFIDRSASTINFRTVQSKPLVFATNNSEAMRILSGGNVGIGTTNPGYKLTVDNDDLNTNNPALYVKNPNSSTAALIAEFVGDSDSIQIKNIGTGDYAIYNSQQSNGIALYDGTGGVEIHYNGATVLEADSNGGVKVTGQLSATGDVVAYSSDQRLKENIKPIENAVDKIKQLKGVTFDWNEKSEELGFEPSTKINDVGVIAQDVEAVFPQLVQLAPFDIGSDEDGNATSKSGEDYKTVNYARLTAVLIEAVKEQQQQIDELKAKLDGITK